MQPRATPSAFARGAFLAELTLGLLLAGTSFAAEDDRHSGYVGDERCATCHAEQAQSYRETAHAHTTQWPSAESVHGSFEAGKNRLNTANPNLFFVMEKKGRVFSQTAVLRTSGAEALTRTEAIAIVVGSGRKGQSYLYWDRSGLYQLPVSYWTEIDAWVNSPGYVDGAANFERPIEPRCLECHASAFESHAPPVNRYGRAGLTLGISCERCHGPGEKHSVAFETQPRPKAGAATLIVNPKKLPRDRQMDICALCHAGIGEATTAPLSFQPGDQLDQHLVFPAVDPNAPLDVHASQIQLLKQSRCYAGSTLTCATCHDVHRTQRDVAAFSKQCLSCHQVKSCGEFPKRGAQIASGCVDCHMPLQETSQIVSAVGGSTLQPKVRNHRIAVYRK